MPSRAYRCLRPGDLLAVVAPAGPAEPAQVQAVPALIESFGYRARLYLGCTSQHARLDYLAGSDAQRLADLHAAFADDEVAAVWCLRGGYGSARLLSGINVDLLRTHAKPLIGYSDITALHCLLDRAGLIALHAPMPASDLVAPGPEAAADARALFDLLRAGLRAGSVLAPALDAQALRVPGVARARLVGGNLSLLASLTGTPWQLASAGCVLFLEEVGEDNYRIDRLLLQLRASGQLDGAAGFVLGSFTEADDASAVLADYLVPLGKPVLGGWPAGHGRPNLPLPLGVQVTLDASAGTLVIEEDVLLS